MEINKKGIEFITSGIISLILANFGVRIISQEKYIGIITIIIAFVLLYLSYYSLQIRINEKKIKEIGEWIETKEELLNTMKDIIILKKISKIK